MEGRKILSVKDLKVEFRVRGRILTAIRGISLDFYEGESVAIVGESGSGKSVLTKTFSGMLEENGKISNGSIEFEGRDLAKLKGAKVAALSAIACPASFEGFLEELGATLVWKDHYADHHRYTSQEILDFINQAKAAGAERILIAGDVTVTPEAAEVFARSGIRLLGNEGQTIGPENAPMQVHLILLRREIALLEGIVLQAVPEGHYFLSAAPLNLGGCDGAPCRACLIDFA